MLRLSLLLITAIALFGCATTGSPEYAAYVKMVEAQTAASEKQRDAFADMAAACTDSRCVEHVAAVAALAMAGGSNQPAPQQYVHQPSTAARIGLALVGQIAPLASAAVAWHSQDTSRDIALGQYGFLGSVIGDLTDATASIATAGPRITVGGNYGDTWRDTYGDDYTGGDRTTTTVGRDQIGRDRIDNSGVMVTGIGNTTGDRNFNTGRQDSPDTDNSDNSNNPSICPPVGVMPRPVGC